MYDETAQMRADYMRERGTRVDVDHYYPSVSISGDDFDVFLDDDDAREFIDAVAELELLCPDLGYEDWELAAAFEHV